MEAAWVWLATAMNSRPSDTTPIALNIFLDVCGYTMNIHYPTQFKKLLRHMHNILLPKLKSFSQQQSSKRMEAHIIILEHALNQDPTKQRYEVLYD
mmetsp:Transcript_13664/g.17202  ORF Transcript_13664/g.17202 Transcript_13664/m.17202 type:complete len:96 (+) Transcript_13664:1329-1616(+)